MDACDVGIDHFSIHISFTHSAASRVGASADMPHARAGARARTSDYGTFHLALGPVLLFHDDEGVALSKLTESGLRRPEGALASKMKV